MAGRALLGTVHFLVALAARRGGLRRLAEVVAVAAHRRTLTGMQWRHHGGVALRTQILRRRRERSCTVAVLALHLSQMRGVAGALLDLVKDLGDLHRRGPLIPGTRTGDERDHDKP
jgi:hypothetical protein